jgi:hypothetical protein
VNVRITPRSQPERTDLYGGIKQVRADAGFLILIERANPDSYPIAIPLKAVAEIALDEDPGDYW